MTDILIRDARDDDGDDLIALVAACWSAYPGCILDVDGDNAALRRFASTYGEKGGHAWIAEDAGRIVGSAAVAPTPGGGTHIQTLYVDPALRRRGLARRLVALIEDQARSMGAAEIALWTDTRFVEAHAFYERLGYERQPGTRSLNDTSRSVEYNFVKTLAP